jgi:hypothetical protein
MREALSSLFPYLEGRVARCLTHISKEESQGARRLAEAQGAAAGAAPVEKPRRARRPRSVR